MKTPFQLNFEKVFTETSNYCVDHYCRPQHEVTRVAARNCITARLHIDLDYFVNAKLIVVAVFTTASTGNVDVFQSVVDSLTDLEPSGILGKQILSLLSTEDLKVQYKSMFMGSDVQEFHKKLNTALARAKDFIGVPSTEFEYNYCAGTKSHFFHGPYGVSVEYCGAGKHRVHVSTSSKLNTFDGYDLDDTVTELGNRLHTFLVNLECTQRFLRALNHGLAKQTKS